MPDETTLELLITRGLPRSGKSTMARQWVAEDPARRLRVNRDDLRMNLFGKEVLDGGQEKTVTAVQHAAVKAALQAHKSVVVDDTNLRLSHARAYADMALTLGVRFRVQDFTTDVETCVARDKAGAERGERSVPEEVIRGMAKRYRFPLPLVTPTVSVTAGAGQSYVPEESLPRAVMVDVDGTVALLGDRLRFEEHKVGVDLQNPNVIEVVQAMHLAGLLVVFCSGRGSGCYEQTRVWLTEHVGVPIEGLFMRPQGDMRKDSVVKIELFDAHIRDRYRVVVVLDDRDQVVKAWRDLGLTVLQVAPGAF